MARFIFGGSPADVVVTTVTNDTTLYFAPNTVLTAWDAEVGGSRITDLQLSLAGNPVTSITSTAQGRIPRFYGPEGVTQLWLESGAGSRYVLVSTDLGSVVNGKLGREETPHTHTHAIEDTPVAARQLPLFIRAVKLSSTNQWPLAGDVTATYPPAPLWLVGNAVPPAYMRPGDYLDDLLVTQGPTVVPTPTPDPTPDPDPITGVAMSQPVVSSVNGTVTVSATLTTTAPVTFAYVQIAVRGPSGQQNDVAFNNGVTVDGTLNLSGTFTTTVAGAWDSYGTYNITGGTDQASWVDGPHRAFTVTISSPPPGGGVPARIANVHASRSLMPWNSGAFVDGNLGSQWNQSSQTAFGTYRGRPSDVMLCFNDAASDFQSLTTFQSSWVGWPGIFVWTIPPQPRSVGNNQSTANGNNNSWWLAAGQSALNAGMNNNRLVARIGHEANGDWQPWRWSATGGGAAYAAAWKNARDNFKTTCPNALANLCINKDWDNQGGYTWIQMLDECQPDIVGLDAYDLYAGFRNDAGRKTAWYNNSGPQRDSVAAWCRANNKLISLDEWGLISTSGADGTGGGDDVLYITNTYDWCYTNRDILAYESYFMAPGNTGYNHELNNGQYPNAQAAYRNHVRWGNL